MLLEVNKINLYYEKIGQGKPFLLLHGNGESHKIFHKLSKLLCNQYTVYAIDSRGHGRSTKEKKLEYGAMAEDIVQFIKALNLDKPILYGFSDGGILGLMIASAHPKLLSKLIISGANLNPDGIKSSDLRMMRRIYSVTKSSKIHLMLTQPDIKDEELKKISIPTLVLAGSKDLILEEHTKHIAEGIQGSTLKIIQGEGHMSYVIDNKKLFEIMSPFCNYHIS